METSFNALFSNTSTPVMPAVFVGHGSPLNGIDDNAFTREWQTMAQQMPTPKAVLCISAHWLTRGTLVTAMEHPRTIHDFGGFPNELYQVNYPAMGNPMLANDINQTLAPTPVGLDHEWGLDHGCWTIVRHMYPNADIPVLQLSIDYTKPHQWHYNVAKQLCALRKKGVLVMGSGNLVHNLRQVAWDKLSVEGFAYDWAIEANELLKDLIKKRDIDKLSHYEELGAAVNMAIPSPDHFWPLLYTLALAQNNDELSFFNDQFVGGSLNMTSVKLSNG